MGPKTAILFPGLDAVFVTAKLKEWAEVPYVQSKLNEASRILEEATEQKEDLLAFVRENRRLHIADFDRTLVVLTTLQVAIAEKLKEEISVELVVGCSHGDIARNVVCGVLDFQSAIEILWAFAELRKICPPGYTASVRSSEGVAFSKKQKDWLLSTGAKLSTWSESHGTIGGEASFIEKISKEGKEKSLKIKAILPYPVHSDAMSSLVDQMLSLGKAWDFKAPHYKVFSSIWLKYIEAGDECFEEGVAGAVSPVKWAEALHFLHVDESVDTFINIGPSNTLTGWLLESEKFKDVKVIEAWEMLMEKVKKEPLGENA